MTHIKTSTKKICFFVLISLVFLILMISGCSHKSDNIPTKPESVESLINDGWEAFQAGDYNKAILNFEQTLKRNVDPEISINAYRGLGWTYSRIEKYSQAITNFSFVISLETVRTKRLPVINSEKVPAFAIPDTADVRFNGNWQMTTDAYIVNVEDVESYNTRVNQKLGPAPAFILDPGIESINLPKSEISNKAGTDLGSPLDNSLSFSPDSLKTAVHSVEDMASLYDFYLDAQKGVVEILPRIYKLENITANFKYHEKGYIIKRTENQFVSLEKTLDDLTKTPPDSVGDIYYLKGSFYNKYNPDDPTSGGTFLQADAYAGMSAVYLAQGEFQLAINAARALIYINQDLKTMDETHFPYKRSLYESDNSFDLWDFYKILAISCFNVNDYLGAEKIVEINMDQGKDAVDNSKAEFIFDLLTKINSLPDDAPGGWMPVDIW
ncbi:hypothetical protein JXQ31_20710 [candidate division KSB1 bacterium]|nr:hypothetical protein [candidate division KSB1 bacterium]